MCEFCHKHGEGKKWYLQAKNYSEDLLSDARRRKFTQDFFSDPEGLRKKVAKLKSLAHAPAFVRRLMAWRIPRKMKKWHYGQVVPIEEIEQILGFVNSIVRVSCLCRYLNLGQEKRYCFGVSVGPNGGFDDIMKGLDGSYLSGFSFGLETMTKDQALAAMKEMEHEGLCHTVWTFGTPFIGGICNCDRADCLAMQSTIGLEIPSMFRAEYVAEVNPDACAGCRECQRVCPFGTLAWSASTCKTSIDQAHCWGCGVCRSVCPSEAIRLVPRTAVPLAANVW